VQCRGQLAVQAIASQGKSGLVGGPLAAMHRKRDRKGRPVLPRGPPGLKHQKRGKRPPSTIGQA